MQWSRDHLHFTLAMGTQKITGLAYINALFIMAFRTLPFPAMISLLVKSLKAMNLDAHKSC